jgi:hypothetical protein
MFELAKVKDGWVTVTYPRSACYGGEPAPMPVGLKHRCDYFQPFNEVAIENATKDCLCTRCTKSASILLCFSCGIVKLKAQRFRVTVSTVKDAELASAWSETNIRRVLLQKERQEKKSTTKKKGTRQERDQQLQEKTIQLQQWLSDIHAVKYCSKKGCVLYVRCVADGEEKTKLLERKFMEESVLLLDEEFIEQLKKKTSQVIMKLLRLSKKT